MREEWHGQWWGNDAFGQKFLPSLSGEHWSHNNSKDMVPVGVGREAQAQVRVQDGQNGPHIQCYRAKGTALCDRISRQTNMGNIVMLQTASSRSRWGLLQKTVRNLMIASSGPHGKFDHPGICWRGSTAGYKQSRRFLKYTAGNFLTYIIEELIREGTLLSLRPKTKEKHIR